MKKITKRWIWGCSMATVLWCGGVCVWRPEASRGAAFGGAIEQASLPRGGRPVVLSSPGATQPRSRAIQIVSQTAEQRAVR